MMWRVASGLLALTLASAPAAARRAERPVSHELRIALEVIGGLAGSIIGGAAGYGVGVSTVSDDVLLATDVNGLDGLAATLFGGVPGLAIGLPVRLYVVGEALGGDGSYWATWGGVAVGSVVPLLATLLVAGDDPRNPALTALWIVLPTVGGVVGYELSQREPLRRAPTTTLWAAPIDGGVVVGLSGGFD